MTTYEQTGFDEQRDDQPVSEYASQGVGVGFDERVGLVAQELDRIRYEDGVEYTHTEEANEYDQVLRGLQANATAGRQMVENTEMSADVTTYIEEQNELIGQLLDISDAFSDIKYNGETESGPGAFLVMVDGPAAAFAEYANEKKAGKKDATLNGTEWGKNNLDPHVGDEDLAQLIYETMERNDGAIVVGHDGFLPKTYKVPDASVPDGKYPEKGGTKHRAAVDAVYADIPDEYGEIRVNSLVLSETDGFVRLFRKDQDDLEFWYDAEKQPRIGQYWESGSE